jgi:hypothetical protein
LKKCNIQAVGYFFVNVEYSSELLPAKIFGIWDKNLLFVYKYIKSFYNAEISLQPNNDTTCCVIVGLEQKTTQNGK